MKIFESFTEFLQSVNEKKIKFNDKIYYHGRRSTGNYKGKYIYITDSVSYAIGYSDGKIVYEYKIPFKEDKIFSIKNSKHLKILKTITDEQGFKNIIKDSQGGELDWTSLQYIYNDDFELGEELLEDMGFLGIKLKERPDADSILIFDQSKLEQIGVVDVKNFKKETEGMFK